MERVCVSNNVKESGLQKKLMVKRKLKLEILLLAFGDKEIAAAMIIRRKYKFKV